MRRIHLPRLQTGEIRLPDDQAHYLRDVLRLRENQEIEIFDDTGQSAAANILRCTSNELIVDIGEIRPASSPSFQWTIASAIPKGPRADWMIEKLSELGTTAFVPLLTSRSIVVPAGIAKVERWRRISSEAARQSNRIMPMSIDPPTPLTQLVQTLQVPAWYFSPQATVNPADATQSLTANSIALLIGPEGGWTDDEHAMLDKAGLTPVALGETILRVETAAVAAAAIAATILAPAFQRRQSP